MSNSLIDEKAERLNKKITVNTHPPLVGTPTPPKQLYLKCGKDKNKIDELVRALFAKLDLFPNI